MHGVCRERSFRYLLIKIVGGSFRHLTYAFLHALTKLPQKPKPLHTKITPTSITPSLPFPSFRHTTQHHHHHQHSPKPPSHNMLTPSTRRISIPPEPTHTRQKVTVTVTLLPFFLFPRLLVQNSVYVCVYYRLYYMWSYVCTYVYVA